MVKLLLEQGADLEHKTDEMHTALMEASMDGHVDVARYLLDRGAHVRCPSSVILFSSNFMALAIRKLPTLSSPLLLSTVHVSVIFVLF